jgi:hypothetical protein
MMYREEEFPCPTMLALAQRSKQFKLSLQSGTYLKTELAYHYGNSLCFVHRPGEDDGASADEFVQ